MITPETISFLLKKGFIVMPLRRGTKDKPKVSGWGKDKDVNQEDLMRNYFRLDNLAILTVRKSNLTVIDLDVKNEGVEKFYQMCKKLLGKREFPNTFTVRSATGGYHLYFKYNSSFRNIAGKGDLLGIDIRNNGGYIV